MMDKPTAGPPVPEIGEGKRGETGHLGYLLRQANASFRLCMERSLADQGATLPQFLILTMIRAYPGLSNADLARLTMLTPQTVSVIVGNLKRSGAVVSAPHPVHGRVRELALSEAGEGLLDRCRERAAEVEARLTDGLPQHEEEVVRRWLVTVAREGRP
jgi:DNA-binding MarR family transcriptional regulator